MFKTKRALRQENEQLKERIAELEALEFRSAVIKEADLKPCQSQVCILCARAAVHVDKFGNEFLVGCMDEVICKGFIPKNWKSAPNSLQSSHIGW